MDVAAGEVSGLSYWVKHSSLGGQDIILYWVRKNWGPAGNGSGWSSSRAGKPDEKCRILGTSDPQGTKIKIRNMDVENESPAYVGRC